MFEQTVGEVREMTYPSRQGWTSKVTILDTERGKFVVKHSTGKYAAWLEQEARVLRDLEGVESVPRVQDIFDPETDRAAFYRGYGCDPITDEEFRYFDSLYDFF